DDSFYLTGCRNFRNEIGGYHGVEGRLSKCLGWVFDHPNIHHASEAAFSKDGRVLDPYRTHLSTTVVKALICTQDWVRKSRTQINWEDVEDLIKDDEIVKDMKEQLEKLTGRDKAKQTRVTAEVLPDLNEKDTIAIDVEDEHYDRLKIPASFLKLYPMHMYNKCFIRHHQLEYLMTVKTDFHREDPDRRNNIGVDEKWRQFGLQCGFAPTKMIRFKYMYTVRNLDGGDEGPFPIFDVC
nr:zinc finger BED domain-containing protein RICESLEEPER 2 [Tanacetum cinerariifolium]